ncbi:phosphodiester glycosidase family protein [Desulfitobacterium sp.]|uniref:phosphodiester glycosidase family protein n=1 Tax=Desulfitobacterium sp. TaxID=49981 RepID=UPI002B1F2414|nr:phosphodiester glycosidase family protein [Desulfitobacterium sp.]MEA4900521.1 phosphodiester glycosidase family protein [Desulfitobacterium sp.]
MKKRQMGTKKIRWKKVLSFLLFNLVLAAVLAPFIVFWGPFGAIKVLAVGSIETSRHPQVVEFFLSDEKISEIMHTYDSTGAAVGLNVESSKVVSDPSLGITIEDIKGQNFKGKVMLIKDPTRVKVAVTKEIGVAGERLSDFVKDTGAIAAINAGGFYDQNGKGNGAFPDGVTVHNGEIVHNNVGNTAVNLVALDKNGKLLMGNMTADDIGKKNIQEAVTFGPNLVVNGQPAVSGDGGWGIAPRTGIGQKADGTIIFLVIDGRQPTYSIGATLRDMMNVFIEYDAVNAVNLDGGSSSEMVYNGKVMNKLWNVFGERYLPTAFVVMPK